ncbi:MAG: ROK family protein [Bacteroidota bacterium]
MEEKKQIAIGADIGGSHISCAAIDLSTHTIINGSYSIVDVDNHANAKEIISKWSNAIKESLDKIQANEPVGIGFAMPGPFDYIKGIGLFEGENEKFENLNGVNVIEKLQESLNFNSEVSIRFMNDATAFAVGAVWADDKLADKSVLAITLGTGFGSAFIKNTLPVLQGETVPKFGCLYHLPFKDGIADQTFSTRGLTKSYKEKSGIDINGVKEIADKATSDENAVLAFKQFGKELAEFLSPWIKKASINSIVIGGNISKAHTLFLGNLKSELKVLGDHPDISISSENDLQAILGAARLSEENYWNKIQPLLKYM